MSPVVERNANLGSLYGLRVVDLLWSENSVAVEPACVLVLPLTGDLEVIATTLAYQFFHALDDFCTVASVLVAFIDSKVHDSEILSTAGTGGGPRGA